MSDKRRVKRTIKQIQRVKTWQLIILLILSGFLTATLLRLNNVGMVQRRDAVISADKSGNIDDITSRLYDLQRYSAAHMNAGSTVFYLQQQYNRDVQKAVAAASQSDNPNGNVYAKADAVCRPQYSGYSLAYQDCFMSELSKYPSAPNLRKQADLPNPDLYRYDFVSPLWSPDFAGLAVVVTLLIAVSIVVRLLTLVVLRLLLKRHYRGV